MPFKIAKYQEIKDFIANISIINHETSAVSLISVSKNQPIKIIKEAINLGIKIFGENRVQEAEIKFNNLKAQYKDLELHMIGSLQSKY